MLIPFLYQNITYLGEYVLCFADWESKIILGTVHTDSYKKDILPRLFEQLGRGNSVCDVCEQHPINQLKQSDAAGEDVIEKLEKMTTNQKQLEKQPWFHSTAVQVRQYYNQRIQLLAVTDA